MSYADGSSVDPVSCGIRTPILDLLLLLIGPVCSSSPLRVRDCHGGAALTPASLDSHIPNYTSSPPGRCLITRP
jgi:hypothetical protein